MTQEELVWDHFKLNAEQRLKSFNFFLLVSIFANGGVINAIDKNLNPVLLLLLGIFLCVLSIVFRLTDERSKNLLKLSVDALLKMEENYDKEFKLFDRDKNDRSNVVRYSTAISTLLLVQFAFGVGLCVYVINENWL